MSSVREFAAIAGGSRSDRCVSLAVALLIFAFWLDRPGRLIGRPAIRQDQ